MMMKGYSMVGKIWGSVSKCEGRCVCSVTINFEMPRAAILDTNFWLRIFLPENQERNNQKLENFPKNFCPVHSHLVGLTLS